MILVSVYDKKSSTYWAPQAFPHNAGAMRAFSQAFNNPDSTLAQFPEDYALYIMAEFDEISGTIEPVVPPNFLEEILNLNFHHQRNGNTPQARKEKENEKA